MIQDTNVANEVSDYDDNKRSKLPSGLNVLTILTFIGCAFFGLLTIFSPQINEFLLDMMVKANSSGDLPAEAFEKGKAAIQLSQQNMVPLMTINLIGIVLCFIGALWMRKLKKDGYWIYLAGEIAPIVATAFILGTSQYTSIWSILIGVGIPLVFVILYSIQVKYLGK